MGYEEQVIMQANMAKKQQHQGGTEVAGETVAELGIELAAEGIDAVADVADAADGIVDGVADAADDLPGLVVVGIVAGAVTIVGGIIWIVKKLSKMGK